MKLPGRSFEKWVTAVDRNRGNATPLSFKAEALRTLQAYLETYITKVIADAELCRLHSPDQSATRLRVDDLELALRLRRDHSFFCKNETK